MLKTLVFATNKVINQFERNVDGLHKRSNLSVHLAVSNNCIPAAIEARDIIIIRAIDIL